MRMGGIPAFYQWSVSDGSQVVRWFPSCVCHIAVMFMTCWKRAAVLLNSSWMSSWSNYLVITNIFSKVLIDVLMHRTDRSGCPLRTWGLSACPRQIPSCPSSFHNNTNNGRNVGIMGLRKVFTGYSRFHICLDKQ